MAVVRRVFGDGEDPLNWALPLYSAWGIRVRVHLIFVVWIIAQLIWSIRLSDIGPWHMLLGMAGLFVLVLLHEYGHCVTCRFVGGEADRILLWPLGGLAYCLPPDTWRANLLTTLGGPAVNAVLWPILGLAVWATHSGPIMFNPFSPGVALGAASSYWQVALWWLYYMNLLLLAFNMLLPMYPMDCGRAFQAVLWAKLGYRRSMDISTTVGLVVAVIVGVVALVGQENLLLGIALFGGITCWLEKRRVRFAGDEDWSMEPEPPEPVETRGQRRRRERERAEAERVDEILAKISESGMGNLTGHERRLLKRVTKRKRHG